MIGYGDSSTTYDFFEYNAAGNVYNGSAYVAWADGDYASYRRTATQAGTSGRFTGTAQASTVRYELRERGASLALSYVVWTDEVALTANAISTQIANDITEASNNWDDALPALIPTIKSGARQALGGRWTNLGSGTDRDDISVGDIP